MTSPIDQSDGGGSVKTAAKSTRAALGRTASLPLDGMADDAKGTGSAGPKAATSARSTTPKENRGATTEL